MSRNRYVGDYRIVESIDGRGRVKSDYEYIGAPYVYAGDAASVKAANDDPSAVAPLVAEAGIIDSEAVAAKAIPDCHLVCITGDEMKTSLSGYLKTLLGADPSSVGGTLPGDDFYYVG